MLIFRTTVISWLELPIVGGFLDNYSKLYTLYVGDAFLNNPGHIDFEELRLLRSCEYYQ